MTFKRRTGGAFVDIVAPKRRAAGAWVAVQNVKRRISGAWVTVWTAITVVFNDQTIAQTGSTLGQVAGYRINASGIAEAKNKTVYSTLETWLTSGAAADFEVYCTATGDTPSGTLTTWVSLSGSPEWTLGTSTIGEALFTGLTLQVRVVATGVVVDTWTVSLEAERF